MHRNTICLVVIFKNEENFITDLLESVDGYIDYAIFLDSDSDDESVHLINTHMSGTGIKWEVHNFNFTGPFRGDHKRTRALQLAYDKADYCLVMDADNTLDIEMGKVFEANALSSLNDVTTPFMPVPYTPFCDLDQDAYYIEKKCGDIKYPIISLFRGDLNWEYLGIIHDYPQLQGGGAFTVATLPGVLVHEPVKSSGPRHKDAFHFYGDALILERELYDNGKELPELLRARYMFYLAQSYRDAGMHDRAIDAYQARIQMGGWQEEVFYSLYQIAKIKQAAGHPAHEVASAAMAAWNYRPQRLEAACMLIWLFNQAGFAQAAYAVALRSCSLNCDDTLFIEYDCYTKHFPELLQELVQKFGL